MKQTHHYCSRDCANKGRRKEVTKVRRMLTLPGHPLADRQGHVPEYRIILFNAIGWGPHPCYWCGTQVDWLPGQGTKTGALVVDHLDSDWRRNDLSNLAPTCQGCNGTRERRVRDDEAFITKPNGFRVRAERRSCLVCGTAFLVESNKARDPKRGLYCSRRCMYDRGSSKSPPATGG